MRSSSSSGASESATDVTNLRVDVLRKIPHDPGAYTQGLLWHEGKLYESTGHYGESDRHCQVDGKLVRLTPRYWALARREPAMLGIKNGR